MDHFIILDAPVSTPKGLTSVLLLMTSLRAVGAVVDDKRDVVICVVELMESTLVVKLFNVEAEDATVIPRHSYEPIVFLHRELV